MYPKTLSILAAAMLCIVANSSATATGAPVNDPTRPPDAASVPQPAASEKNARNRQHKFTLQAILVAKDRRSAIIDKHPARVGDRIHGAKVVAIDSNQVQLRYGGRTITLKLPIRDFKHAGDPNVDSEQQVRASKP
ncbi:MAG: hypothetical protein GC138_07810 [Gammaproteobacteria bacterium]|nr:hypothetical protein [Gammaproteobacteria bacterium]